MTEQPPSFEETLAELEDVVARLEAGELSLEDMVALFERGQELAALCNKALDEADLRLEQLKAGVDGTYEKVPFDESER